MVEHPARAAATSVTAMPVFVVMVTIAAAMLVPDVAVTKGSPAMPAAAMAVVRAVVF
jgi:hypothetical protein